MTAQPPTAAGKSGGSVGTRTRRTHVFFFARSPPSCVLSRVLGSKNFCVGSSGGSLSRARCWLGEHDLWQSYILRATVEVFFFFFLVNVPPGSAVPRRHNPINTGRSSCQKVAQKVHARMKRREKMKHKCFFFLSFYSCIFSKISSSSSSSLHFFFLVHSSSNHHLNFLYPPTNY